MTIATRVQSPSCSVSPMRPCVRRSGHGLAEVSVLTPRTPACRPQKIRARTRWEQPRSELRIELGPARGPRTGRKRPSQTAFRRGGRAASGADVAPRRFLLGRRLQADGARDVAVAAGAGGVIRPRSAPPAPSRRQPQQSAGLAHVCLANPACMPGPRASAPTISLVDASRSSASRRPRTTWTGPSPTTATRVP